jgi:hypothetical protein
MIRDIPAQSVGSQIITPFVDPDGYPVELLSLGSQLFPIDLQGLYVLRRHGLESRLLGGLFEQGLLALVEQLPRRFRERRRQVLMVQHLVLVGVDRQHRCQQGDEGVEDYDGETDQGHPVLLQPPPGVQPEADPLDRFAELVEGKLGFFYAFALDCRVCQTDTPYV